MTADRSAVDRPGTAPRLAHRRVLDLLAVSLGAGLLVRLALAELAAAGLPELGLLVTALTVAARGRCAGLLPHLPGLLAVLGLLDLALTDRPAVLRPELLVAGVVVALAVLRNAVAHADHSSLAQGLTRSRDTLAHQALHDPLTGLANRTLFTERLAGAVARHRADRHPLAVLFLDLDDFKGVNDTLGHPAGDDLLVQVGQRLTGQLRASDVVARFGGDEFAVLLTESTDTPLVVARLDRALQEPYRLAGAEHAVPASVGFCDVAPDDPTPTSTQLLTRADEAMYAAKQGGKGRLVAWTSGGGLVQQLPLVVGES